VAQEEDRIHARENSTLVFATVAASASLLILTFVLQKFVPPQILWINSIGFIFSILGPLYREVTIFSIDRIDYRGIRKREYPWWATIPRMTIVRFFLFLPIAAWLIYFTSSKSLLTTLIFTFVFALLLSVIEWQDMRLQREPMKREREEAQPPQKEMRERTDYDADVWFWETFSMITNSGFIACLIASVPAQGWWKIGWGISFIMFGVLFLYIRLKMGRRIHAPRRHIYIMVFFLIAIIIIGILLIIWPACLQL